MVETSDDEELLIADEALLSTDEELVAADETLLATLLETTLEDDAGAELNAELIEFELIVGLELLPLPPPQAVRTDAIHSA
jgi:hypothetical protein